MEILSNLSVYLSNPRTSLNNKLLKICMTVKSAIPTCDRVGIWLFSKDYTEMFLLMGVDESGKQSIGEHLLASDFTEYFSHIIENEFLVASDARSDEVAKCFNVGYFDVHNIYSLLDVTFTKDFEPLGIICCERTKDTTQWQPQDIKVLKSISVKTSLFVSNNISDTYASKSKEDIIELLSD